MTGAYRSAPVIGLHILNKSPFREECGAQHFSPNVDGFDMWS